MRTVASLTTQHTSKMWFSTNNYNFLAYKCLSQVQLVTAFVTDGTLCVDFLWLYPLSKFQRTRQKLLQVHGMKYSVVVQNLKFNTTFKMLHWIRKWFRQYEFFGIFCVEYSRDLNQYNNTTSPLCVAQTCTRTASAKSNSVYEWRNVMNAIGRRAIPVRIIMSDYLSSINK